MNATTLAATTSTEGVYTVNAVSASAAVEGDNVVAVEVHQVNDTSSDIVMGSTLFATYATPNTAPLILVQPVSAAVEAGTPVTLTSAADGTGTLLGSAFQAGFGHAAATADTHFLYDWSNGQLWYDVDGSGVKAAKLLLTLNNFADLAASDIIIF